MITLRRPLPDTRTDGGWTLIELLIVVVILGVLAAIVVFNVGGTRKDAVAGACATDGRQVDSAAGAYLAHNSSLAPDVSTLVTSGNLKSAPNTLTGTGDYWITYTPSVSGTTYTVTGTRKTDGSQCYPAP